MRSNNRKKERKNMNNNGCCQKWGKYMMIFVGDTQHLQRMHYLPSSQASINWGWHWQGVYWKFVYLLPTKKIESGVSISVRYTKGIYNRLPLIMSYLLDIDLALWSLLLPWGVKFNKSWNTFFAIEILIHIHSIIQTLATFQCYFHQIMVLL